MYIASLHFLLTMQFYNHDQDNLPAVVFENFKTIIFFFRCWPVQFQNVTFFKSLSMMTFHTG